MKRGTSGISLVVAVDKPVGPSSHDMVNACRSIFGERRVGHLGTLDPLASGVLLVCVGPAARLDAYVSLDDKEYLATMAFGYSTETDDIEGAVLEQGVPRDELLDKDFARRLLQGFLGPHMQVPPIYSAIKKDGKKACNQARKGEALALEPRPIEIFRLELQDIRRRDGLVEWVVSCRVSKGTYIRSLARDMGAAASCPAHLAGLRRMSSGTVGLDECHGIEEVRELTTACAYDPVKLLGFAAIEDDSLTSCTEHGSFLPVGSQGVEGYPAPKSGGEEGGPSLTRLKFSHGQFCSMVYGNELKGIYRYDAKKSALVPACIFSQGVRRG